MLLQSNYPSKHRGGLSLNLLPPFPLNHPLVQIGGLFYGCRANVHVVGGDTDRCRVTVSAQRLFLRNFLTSAFNCHRSQIWEC